MYKYGEKQLVSHGEPKDKSSILTTFCESPNSASTENLCKITPIITHNSLASSSVEAGCIEPEIKSLINAIPDPMLVSTFAGVILVANDLAAKLFAYHHTELIGLTIEDLMPERFRSKHQIYRELYAKNPFVRKMEQPGVNKKNFYGLTKNGEEIPIDISLNVLSLKEKYIIIGIKDLTPYYCYEKQLQEQTAEITRQTTITASLRQQEDIMNFFSHEIRTLLHISSNVIYVIESSLIKLQTTQLVAEKQAVEQNLKEHMAILLSVNEQQKILVNQLLTFSKSQQKTLKLQLVNCELKETIQQIMKVFHISIKNKNLELRLELPANPLWVKLDRNLLTIIINNLISNAIKFTEQGYIAFYVTIQSSINSCIEEVAVNFVIQDTGIGMSAEEVSKLCQKFVQANQTIETKYGGSGLGLYIIKNLIELMGGTIDIESIPSQGSKFSFSIIFPSVTAEELLELNVATPRELQKEIKFLGKRILIAEDNRINASISYNYLTEAGCICNIAANGEEVLKLVATNDFDMILMDLEMPILGGIEATQRIRTTIATPIIGITGHTEPAIQEMALESGMNAILAKPYDFNELSKLLKTFFHPSQVGEASSYKKKNFPAITELMDKGKETSFQSNCSQRSIMFFNNSQKKITKFSSLDGQQLPSPKKHYIPKCSTGSYKCIIS